MIRPDHDNRSVIISNTKGQHLGHKGADLAWREIHHRHDLPADQIILAVMIGNLGR